jgi:predicted CxxxxCH...CXXCH cytochrome family protein
MRHRSTIAFLLGGLIALCACDARRPATDATAATGANPEACRRCHGSADNAAPPSSVLGLTATSEVAVGAHQAHLRDGPLHQAISCDECHVVPAVVESPGHIDGARADVTFGAIASARGAQPAWHPAQATCATTYCHGAFPGGAEAAPIWTVVDGTQAACGTCHRMGPTSGRHFFLGHRTAGCSACHGGTYSFLAADPAFHVNGSVDLGNRITSWDPVARACVGCHGPAVW